MVSLEGELVEMSGVMSGGGRAKKGAMGQQVVEEISETQFQEVNDKLARAEQALRKSTEDFNRVEQAIMTLQRRIHT